MKRYVKIRYTLNTIPVGITIYNESVVTHISEGGKPICIKIVNKKLAEQYHAYFDGLWKHAKV